MRFEFSSQKHFGQCSSIILQHEVKIYVVLKDDVETQILGCISGGVENSCSVVGAQRAAPLRVM
jgi:hypothetical protein